MIPPGLALVALGAAALIAWFAWRVDTTPDPPTYLVTFCASCGRDVWFLDSPEVVAHLRSHAPDAAAELDFNLWATEPGHDPRGSR